MTTLITDLVAKYFPSGIVPVIGDSKVEVIVDGKDYFQAFYEAICPENVEVDFIYILAWTFDHTLKLVPGAAEIGDLLVEKLKKDQVDVRVIIWSNWIAAIYWPGIAQVNLQNAATMRDKGLAMTLVDYTGELTSSHHTKAAIVGAGGTVTAFVGGIDFGSNRFDDPNHPKIEIDPTTGSYAGCHPLHKASWHDATVKITGRAAIDVWSHFTTRWNNCVAQGSRRRFVVKPPGRPGGVTEPLSNGTSYRWISAAATFLDVTSPPSTPEISAPGFGVAIVRSVSAAKVDEWRRLTPAPPGLPPGGHGILEVRDTLAKAITAAKSYIYVEDQGLNSSMTYGEQAKGMTHARLYQLVRAALRNGVKVIFLTSSESDPADGVAGTVNSTPYKEIRDVIIDPLEAEFTAGVNSAINNFVMFRLNCLTVHSKLVLVDDEFLSIGSANFWDRSMTGEDSELNVAFVSGASSFGDVTDSTLVHDVRVRLWAEHLGFPLPTNVADPHNLDQMAIRSDLDALPQALGVWKSAWRPDPTFRFFFEPSGTIDDPPGPRLSLVYPKKY